MIKVDYICFLDCKNQFIRIDFLIQMNTLPDDLKGLIRSLIPATHAIQLSIDEDYSPYSNIIDTRKRIKLAIKQKNWGLLHIYFDRKFVLHIPKNRSSYYLGIEGVSCQPKTCEDLVHYVEGLSVGQHKQLFEHYCQFLYIDREVKLKDKKTRWRISFLVDDVEVLKLYLLLNFDDEQYAIDRMFPDDNDLYHVYKHLFSNSLKFRRYEVAKEILTRCEINFRHISLYLQLGAWFNMILAGQSFLVKQCIYDDCDRVYILLFAIIAENMEIINMFYNESEHRRILDCCHAHIDLIKIIREFISLVLRYPVLDWSCNHHDIIMSPDKKLESILEYILKVVLTYGDVKTAKLILEKFLKSTNQTFVYEIMPTTSSSLYCNSSFVKTFCKHLAYHTMELRNQTRALGMYRTSEVLGMKDIDMLLILLKYIY